MRSRIAFAIGLCCVAYGTTLQQLTMDDMILKSSAVVRAKVKATRSITRNSNIWTVYDLQILEQWKPAGSTLTEIAVPGGVAGGVRQTVDGAPALILGQEYVLFVWIPRSGLPQLIGLSQGLFNVTKGSSAIPIVSRPAAAERMLDQAGRLVDDEAVRIPLSDLRARVRRIAGAGK